jgi:BirA family biotin operon repressor/biotin-[acetyl-CoA-carboxylase] ligase
LSFSAAHILRALDLPILIKWPNDLILHKKKLGGILCETVVGGGGIWIIVGIGINVNVEQKDLDLVDRPAISLHTASGRLFEIEDIQQALNKRFQADLALFMEAGFGQFFDAYRSLSTLSKGDPVTVNIYPNKYVGSFEALQADGSLNLRAADGALQTYNSGEILE